MSRSFRKAILNDGYKKHSKGYNSKKRKSFYWRTIRHKINQLVKQGEETLPHPKSIINDWNYNDFTTKIEFYPSNAYDRYSRIIGGNPQEILKEEKNKYRRK